MERGVAEQVNAHRDAADRGRLSADEHAIGARLARDHEVVPDVLKAPAQILDLAKRGSRTRRGVAALGGAPPGTACVATHLELDLEEPLPLFFGGRRRPDRRCQERRALALLLRHPGLLGPGLGRAGLLSLTGSPVGIPLISALEHVSSAQALTAPFTRAVTVMSDIS